MKRTYDVSIGGTIFHLEEDAYARLDLYLASVKAHFQAYPDSADIVADIESRIAEQWAPRTAASRVVTLADVERIIGVMGSVEQFGDAGLPRSENDEGAAPGGTVLLERPGRLIRDPGNVRIAGVAAGVAHYYGAAPHWIRLIFLAPWLLVLLAMVTDNGDLGPFAVLLALATTIAYLGLWLLVPVAGAAGGGRGGEGPRRLFRDPDDALIAGVAAGAAHYCGITPRLLRLALLAPIGLLVILGIAADAFFAFRFRAFIEMLFVLAFAEVAAYLLLWLFVPVAKTTTDRLRMRGDPVTLVSVAQQVRGEDAAPGSKPRTGVGSLALAMGLIVRMTVVGMTWAAAILSAVAIVIGTIGLTVVLTMALSNAAIWPGTSELWERLGLKYYPFVICSYLLTVIPLVLIGLALFGAFLKRRGLSWKHPGLSVYTTAVVAWMAALIVWAWLLASSGFREERKEPVVLQVQDGECVVRFSDGATVHMNDCLACRYYRGVGSAGEDSLRSAPAPTAPSFKGTPR